MSVVAALAPARQTGYVQSFESNPASPKIRRPRMEGAPYLMVIRLPAIVAETLAGGLAKSNSAMPIRAMKNLGILISEYYTSRTQHLMGAQLPRPLAARHAAAIGRPGSFRRDPGANVSHAEA